MKFDDMTTSKEVTQKLIDLGVKRTGLFTRFYSPKTGASSVALTCQSASARRGDCNLPAYTIGELLHMIWGDQVESSDVVAESLIGLIEMGFITVEEINQATKETKNAE